MSDIIRHFILAGAEQSAEASSFAFWLSELAEESSSEIYPYIGVGQSGPLGALAQTDAFATPNWSLGAPADAWPVISEEPEFAIWIVPDTDIQNNASARNDAFTSTLLLIDQAQKLAPGAPIVIYQDWADTTPFLLNGRISDVTRNIYFEEVSSAYLDWFEAFTADLQTAFPDLDITLLPAASTAADLALSDAFPGLAETLLPSEPNDGTAARAFVSGAAGYAVSFETTLSPDTTLAEKADPNLAEIYPELSKAMSTALVGADTQLDPEPVTLTGTAADDTFALTPDIDFADLGAGLDTITVAASREATNVIVADGDVVFVQLAGDASPAELRNVERVSFEDGTLAFDDDGIAGQAYRLYQAAFDRTPDAEGLGFWIDELDTGAVTLTEAAELFMTSEEFASAYGQPDEVTDILFLTLLYVNALDRFPDEDGFVFWREQQENGVTRAEMMVYFSESVENTAQVAPAIADGIWYL